VSARSGDASAHVGDMSGTLAKGNPQVAVLLEEGRWAGRGPGGVLTLRRPPVILPLRNLILCWSAALGDAMTRFWILMGTMMAAFLGLFAVAQALRLPLLTDPSPWLSEAGAAAALVGVALLVADVLLPVPASLVMIANGSLFGLVGGMLLSLAGSLGAAFLGFAIGRRGGPLFERLVPEDERRRAGALLHRWGDLAIVVTRPIPILAETVAVLAGASPLGWGRMAAATLAGSLPAAFLYALTGATAAGMDNPVLVFALVLLAAGLFWALGQWGRRPQIPEEKEPTP
jgi:uncharacterized membrane protein YdjX (TVP38/TMEM64 family)